MHSSAPFLAFVAKASLKSLLRTLVRPIAICGCAVPVLGLAQDKHTAPWSIQSVLTPTLQKLQAPAAPAVPVTPSWMTAAPYPTSIYRYGFAQNGDDFYIISGLVSDPYSTGLTPVTVVRRYNVTTNTWTSLADVPVGSASPPAVYYEGKIYLLDGLPSSQNPQLRIYNISTDTWSVGASRPGAYSNYSNAIGAFNGNIYVTGFGRLSIYNIANNSWSEGPLRRTLGQMVMIMEQATFRWDNIFTWSGVSDGSFFSPTKNITTVCRGGSIWHPARGASVPLGQ